MSRPSGIVLAFDDGRGDNYHVWKDILEPLGIPATFNITTAYNDRSEDPKHSPTSIAPIGPEKVAKMAGSNLVEIGCHGKEHICNPEDAKEGEEVLREWIGAKGPLGYACPNSEVSDEKLRGEEWKDFLYIRTGLRIKNFAVLRTMIRKANRILHIPALYRAAFAGCVMTEGEDRILYSASVLYDTKVEEVMELVRYAARRGGHLILLFHSIGEVPASERVWSYDEKKFRRLCDMLLHMDGAGEIRLMTTAQLYALMNR